MQHKTEIPQKKPHSNTLSRPKNKGKRTLRSKPKALIKKKKIQALRELESSNRLEIWIYKQKSYPESGFWNTLKFHTWNHDLTLIQGPTKKMKNNNNKWKTKKRKKKKEKRKKKSQETNKAWTIYYRNSFKKQKKQTNKQTNESDFR